MGHGAMGMALLCVVCNVTSADFRHPITGLRRAAGVVLRGSPLREAIACSPHQ